MVEVVEGLGKTVIAISRGAVAQLGERGLCKPEVVGSIPIISTRVAPRVPGRAGQVAPANAAVFAVRGTAHRQDL